MLIALISCSARKCAIRDSLSSIEQRRLLPDKSPKVKETTLFTSMDVLLGGVEVMMRLI